MRFSNVLFVTLAATLALSACGSPTNVKAREDALRLELAKAKSMGARDCSPEEMARAESQLEFAQIEVKQGDYIRAEDHLEEGFRMAKAAQRGVKNCKQQVVVKATPSPTPMVVVKAPTPSPTPTAIVIVMTPTATPTPQIIIVRETPVPTPTPLPSPSPTADMTKVDSDGDGTPDVRDDCPADAGPVTNGGCPVRDSDGDGVPDGTDACPGTAGTITYKGCPPPDKDKDGVVDDADGCPEVSGPVANKGCPEFKHIVINREKKRIELKQTIHFTPAKAVILRDSFGILDEIISVMKDNVTMEIRIEGHTDSDGPAVANLALSKARADSVRAYMMRGGVAGPRLRAVGLGETTPIADNQSVEGKGLNRRVEFNITKD